MNEEPTYRPLKKEFRSRGFHYKEVERHGDLAIYEQRSAHGSVNWEVIRITRHNGFKIAGLQFPPAEMYPGAGQWGMKGWTLKSLERAQEKLREIERKMKGHSAASLAETVRDAAEATRLYDEAIRLENEGQRLEDEEFTVDEEDAVELKTKPANG